MSKPPTRGQLAQLHRLYEELGTHEDFVAPTTRENAHHAIQHALRKLEPTHIPVSIDPPPTEIQLHDLAVLARRRCEQTPQPATSGEAARLLKTMRGEP